MAGAATDQAAGNWTLSIVTLLATILFSVYLRGTLGQLPVLLGVGVGYLVSAVTGAVDYSAITEAAAFSLPHFTFPKWSPAAILAIMPVAIATIPESTAHLYQIDLYVNNLAKKLGRKKTYPIADLLGSNLIGDGLADIIAGLIGGPAGTNYGENNSVMAITRNFSVPVLGLAAVIAMVLSLFGKLAGVVNSVPAAVIGSVSVYLFGVIGVQGVALMMSEKVDLFCAEPGRGGDDTDHRDRRSFAFPNGMIPMGGAQPRHSHGGRVRNCPEPCVRVLPAQAEQGCGRVNTEAAAGPAADAGARRNVPEDVVGASSGIERRTQDGLKPFSVVLGETTRAAEAARVV